MSPSPTRAEREAAESFYDTQDPLVRAKALYSLLKEMELPEDYISAMNYLIAEIEVAHKREREAQRKYNEVCQWFTQAMEQLKELQSRHAQPQIVRPEAPAWWLDNKWGY